MAECALASLPRWVRPRRCRSCGCFLRERSECRFELAKNYIQATLATSIGHVVSFESHKAGQVVDGILGAKQHQTIVLR